MIFLMNGFALSLGLKQRLGRTRKWTMFVDSHCVFKIQGVIEGDVPMITCRPAREITLPVVT